MKREVVTLHTLHPHLTEGIKIIVEVQTQITSDALHPNSSWISFSPGGAAAPKNAPVSMTKSISTVFKATPLSIRTMIVYGASLSNVFKLNYMTEACGMKTLRALVRR